MIDFPTTPSVGDDFEAAGKKWKCVAVAPNRWKLQPGESTPGISLSGRVADYASLPSSGLSAGDAYLVDSDKLIYVYDGAAFPDEGEGLSMASEGGGNLSAEILADNPRAYYKMDDTGAVLADASGNGYDLNVPAGMTVSAAPLVPSDPDTKYARSEAMCSGDAHNLGLSAPMNYSYSICFIVRRTGAYNTTFDAYDSFFRLFSWGAAGETTASNYQAIIPQASDSTGAKRFRVFWESGAGTDNNLDLRFALLERPSILHFVKDASAKTLSLYINGALWDKTSYVNEPTGGTAADRSMALCGPSGIGGHWAFFDGVLSEDRIAEHAKAAGLYLR